MRYAQVVPFEVCNGKGVGISLFVQGCGLKCLNCFNPDTWDFSGGKYWSKDIEDRFFELLSRYYIKRVTILGGEPLEKQNAEQVLNIVKKIKSEFPDKSLWLFSGYTFNQIINPAQLDCFDAERDKWYNQRKDIVELCDVLVDGRYVDELRDITLPFRGSSNQRVINVQESIANKEIVLYNN